MAIGDVPSAETDRLDADSLKSTHEFSWEILKRREANNMYQEHGMADGFVELAGRAIELTDSQREMLARCFMNYVESNIGQIVADTAPPVR